jgi:hypothetical protein
MPQLWRCATRWGEVLPGVRQPAIAVDTMTRCEAASCHVGMFIFARPLLCDHQRRDHAIHALLALSV